MLKTCIPIALSRTIQLEIEMEPEKTEKHANPMYNYTRLDNQDFV